MFYFWQQDRCKTNVCIFWICTFVLGCCVTSIKKCTVSLQSNKQVNYLPQKMLTRATCFFTYRNTHRARLNEKVCLPINYGGKFQSVCYKIYI